MKYEFMKQLSLNFCKLKRQGPFPAFFSWINNIIVLEIYGRWINIIKNKLSLQMNYFQINLF